MPRHANGFEEAPSHMRRTRTPLLTTLLMFILCTTILVGATTAYFTETVQVSGNVVQSGNLKAGMDWTDNLVVAEGTQPNWIDAADKTLAENAIFNYSLWEPGFTAVRYIRIRNAGQLAFQYQLNILPKGELVGDTNLMDVIDVYYGKVPEQTQQADGTMLPSLNVKDYATFSDYTAALGLQSMGTLSQLNANTAQTWGVMLPTSTKADAAVPSGVTAYTGSEEFCVVLHMQESAGNEYQNCAVGEGFQLQLFATQYTYEKDSFGNDYDTEAKSMLPVYTAPISATADITGKVDANNLLTEDVMLLSGDVSATVHAGTLIVPGTTSLTLRISPMASSNANITLGQAEETASYDVHVTGIDPANTQPLVINMGEVLPKGLNMGNYSLHHVENGATVKMNYVASGVLTAHNDYAYEPATGFVTVALAKFSEVALVAEPAKWEGNFDYSWYTNAVAAVDGEAVTEYTIANADQLAAFSAIVGGMNNQEKDSFSDKSVKLISDIDLGDDEKNNVEGKIFYPIGYYNSTGNYTRTTDSVISSVSAFRGIFDGNGHTIKNFYQNTWEMFGDYNDGYSGTPNYYKDAMGLFGYVVNGTVKNLTVENFSSDGEFTPTGVIAAYAVNSTFENIALTNCTPRVYNTGNGGIVGIGGNTDDPDTYKLTFNNITIDNSNKITALWGSYDVACGGLVGMFRGAGHVYMNNCHVAAQMDVYNDVCGNYQYYWYRYSGMMVGTNKNMVTDEAGYTVPETSKYHAESCTVHFGNWNDYYYCEFEKNGHPSYSGPDDYKFSRVPHSELNFTDSNDNGIIDTDDERNSVTGCKHDHTDVEDNRAIYLPFNQLFTGYGWGVKHIPVYNGADYAFEGITILDREVADSETKFEAKVAANAEYETETSVKIGDLFNAISGKKIKVANVKVFVSLVGDNSTAGGTYTADTTDWTQGTLTFSGTGAATITITDYYFCKPTTINVTITEKVAAEKFDIVINNGDFLHRVGNSGTVALDKLFKAKDGVNVGTVSVTVEAVDGTGASGTYSNNAIQFSGTGVVKVTITDNNYCVPTELLLEVVNAKNITKAENATASNVVLLNNVTNGSFSVGSGYAFYGNGFEITLNPGSHSTKRGAGFDGYVHMTGGTLDNVRIVGPVFAAANIYRAQGETGTGADDPVNYFRNAVIIDSGDCVISNSYISGGRTAVYVKDGGNVVFENTTISGGAYANIEVSVADSVTFKNLTTEQKSQKDSYAQNKDMIGIGIVIDNAETKVIFEGDTEQYNWLTKTQWDTMLGDYVNQFPKLFTDSTYEEYWHYRDGDSTKYVNVALIFACDVANGVSVTNVPGNYGAKSVTLGGNNGVAYAVANAGTLTDALYNAPAYEANAQYPVPPTPKFDYKTKNYQAYVDGANEYCYEDGGVVKISFIKGGSKVWDTSILTVTKGSNTLGYKVKMNDTDYTGKSITFTEAGDYVVTYTYTDPYNYNVGDDGNIVNYEKEYSKTVNITVVVVEEKAKNAEFKMGTSGKPVEKIQIGEKTYLSALDVDASTLTNSTTIGKTSGEINGSWGSTVVDGKTIYFPVVAMGTTDSKWEHTGSWYGCFPVFEGAITITDYANGGTGDAVTYNGLTTTMPSTLWALEPQKYFVYQGTSSKVPTTPSKMTKGTYNGKLCYTTQTDLTASNERGEMWSLATYTYTDNKGATYYWYVGYYCAASTNGCVTPDTLVTLANGTQVRVDSLTGDEQLLVWNMETGALDTAPILFVDSDPEAEYEVITLGFSDGSSVNVIYEHGFWDYDLNRYVYLDENAAQYIGHSFFKQSGNGGEKVKLTSVVIKNETTTAWSPVTAGHLCYFVNGMLSMPGGVGGLFNIFDVDPATMTYDMEAMARDIETYGLFTYEELNAIVELPEEMFEAAGGAYLKVSIGKGNLTMDELINMINRYAKFF